MFRDVTSSCKLIPPYRFYVLQATSLDVFGGRILTDVYIQETVDALF